MGLTARFGESNLFLSLAQGRHLLIRKGAMAARTGDAFLISLIKAVGGADRVSTGMAKLIIADLQSVPDTDPLVKDKALALPEALGLRNGFEIVEDAALQVKDVFNS